MATTTTPPKHNYIIRLAKPCDVPLLAEIERSAGQLFRTVGLDSVADDEPMPAEVLVSYLEVGNLWVAVAKNRGEIVREGKEEEGEYEERGDEEVMEVGMGKGEVVVGFLAAFAIGVTGTSCAESGGTEQKGVDDVKEGREKGRRQHDGVEMRKVLMHIAELSVHAAHHRRGLGKTLMQYFEDAVTERSSDAAALSGEAFTMAATGNANTRLSSREGQEVLGLSLTTYKDVEFNGPFYARFGFEEIPPAEIEKVVGKRGKELWDEEQGKIAMPERRCWMVKWL